jgi:hypothetical protein
MSKVDERAENGILEITEEMRLHANACGVGPEIHCDDFIYRFLLTRFRDTADI